MTGIAPSILFQQGVGKLCSVFVLFSERTRVNACPFPNLTSSASTGVQGRPAGGMVLDSWILAENLMESASEASRRGLDVYVQAMVREKSVV
jgi:hypothetical protein